MLLLVKLALLTLIGEIVSYIGKTTISNAIYGLYSKFAPSALHKQQASLRKDILSNKAELRATSSQDEFAKWAKLRRKLDKQIADLDALNKNIQASQSSGQWVITSFIFVLTTAVPFIYTSTHSKSAVFYLPHGWFGSTGEWLLALPFAPTGGISCAVWMMAIRRTIRLTKSAISELLPSPLPVERHQMPPLQTTTTEKGGMGEKAKKEL